MANDLMNCLNPPPRPVDAGAVPVCGTAPRPGSMVCPGGGSSTGASSTSTGGGPGSCMNQCTDSNHNTWISDCVGTNCTCWFNGRQYCHCTLGTRSCFEGGCCPM